MEQKTCIKCGRENPEHEPRFVKVSVISSSSTSRSGRQQVTTTTTSERIIGVDKCCVCDKCVRSKRRGEATGSFFGALFGTLFVTFIMAIFIMGDAFNSRVATVFFVTLFIAFVVAVITFIVKMKKPMPFVAADIIKKARKTPAIALETIKFIPVDRSLYLGEATKEPNLEVFKTKTGLKTNIASVILSQFVAPGIGDQLVDHILLETPEI